MTKLISSKAGYKKFTVRVASRKHKIRDIWDFILNEQIKLSCVPKTYFWYKDMGKPIIEEIGDQFIEDLSSQDIQRCLNHISKRNAPYSDKTIKEWSAILHRIINYGLAEDYLKKNIFNTNVRRPRGFINDPFSELLDKDEFKIFLQKTSIHPIYKFITWGIALTGLRISEYLAITFDDINYENHTLKVRNQLGIRYNQDENGNYIEPHLDFVQTKTRAGTRVIPLPNIYFYLIEELEIYMKNSPHKIYYTSGQEKYRLILPNRYGKMRSYNSLRQQYLRFLEENAIQQVKFHTIRKTFASCMEDAGVRIEVIAEYLGHELDGYEVTRKHYAKPGLQSKLEALNLYMKYMEDCFTL